MNGRKCPAVPGVQELQQIERLAATNLAQYDAVGAMTKRCPEQFADRHRRQAVLLSPSRETDDVLLLNLNFRRLLKQHNPFMLRNGLR
jgi:hypothetical protein